MADVVIAGPYPPPLGGVSSHVQRAAEVLSESGYVVEVLNHFKGSTNDVVIGNLRRNPALYYLKLRKIRAKVVHYHHAGRLSLLIATALSRSKDDVRRVVTIHNHTLTQALARPLSAYFVKRALGRFDQIVAVSQEIKEVLEQHTIDVPITVMPAYIAAGAATTAEPSNWIPAPFFENANTTLIVSAYRVTRWSPDGDVYGLDVAIKIFIHLAQTIPDIKLAIFLAHPPRGRWAKRYLSSTMKLVAPELSKNVRLWIGESLSPAFSYPVVYLRPTRTDGDAVSIREALDVNVGVVASDVVSRPSGVHVVPIDSISQGAQAVESAMKQARSRNALRLLAVPRARELDESRNSVRTFYRSQIDLAASAQ